MEYGRPKADINWKTVDDLLIAGCSGVEIAGFIGINRHTLYDRCLQDNGIPFSDYSHHRYSKGASILRAHQFAKALGKTDLGDNTLLIWLGKTRLKQEERINHGIVFKEIDPTKRESGEQRTIDSDTAQVSVPTLPGCGVECVPDGD